MALDEVFPDFSALKAAGFAGIACAKPSIMIAMTPRTGSTHLCAALHQAGQSREPTEIFNPRGPAQRERELRGAAGFADYIHSFARDPDAAFIFKTSWSDAAPLAPFLTRLFPQLRVVYINRRDIAAQAVSQVRAEQSRIWHRRAGAPPPPPSAYHFDLARLDALVVEHEREKQSWETWFAAHGISPLRLLYEDFMADVTHALRIIIPAMQLPLRTELPPGIGLEKLADAQSAEWTERLQKHLFNLS